MVIDTLEAAALLHPRAGQASSHGSCSQSSSRVTQPDAVSPSDPSTEAEWPWSSQQASQAGRRQVTRSAPLPYRRDPHPAAEPRPRPSLPAGQPPIPSLSILMFDRRAYPVWVPSAWPITTPYPSPASAGGARLPGQVGRPDDQLVVHIYHPGPRTSPSGPPPCGAAAATSPTSAGPASSRRRRSRRRRCSSPPSSPPPPPRRRSPRRRLPTAPLAGAGAILALDAEISYNSSR